MILGNAELSDEALAECHICAGKYRYVADLLALERRHLPPCAASALVTGEATHSPLSRAVARWEAGLRSHPDREFVAWLLRG